MACLSVLPIGCADPGSDALVLRADLPLHLEDHLDKATIDGSEIPDNLPERIEWRFDEPQPDWKPGLPWNPTMEPPTLTRIEDALRVTLTEGTRHATGTTVGALELDVPGLRRGDWGSLVLRARSSAELGGFYVAFNRRDGVGTASDFSNPYRHFADSARLVPDGAIQTYQLGLDIVGGPWEGPWRQLALWFSTSEPTSIDVLSVSLIPAEAAFASAPAGLSTVSQNGRYRRTLYTHVPGRLTYQVQIPEGGQLDVGLRGVREGVPVTFRVTATPESGEPESLHEETLAEAEHWAERRVDLSHLAGQTVSLVLEANADRAGSVALWGAPTVSGARSSDHPNMIFYVIDGGGADLMSLYGYNRRTTPNLERLAAEGTVFDHAYSNSGWTRPSTASFMTSLHHSVLGGGRGGPDSIPEGVVTMAEHLHGARYQTAVFTTNPNAASYRNLQRGVDVVRDVGMPDQQHSVSSVELHRDFWNWRATYPGSPYWVHFQTTDVHEIQRPVAPFGGLFVPHADRERFLALWDDTEFWRACPTSAETETVFSTRRACLEDAGIDPVWFYGTQRGLYDETMAHQDYQLGRFVERLKVEGDWENTLLIVASDHGHPAGSFSRFGRELFDPPPAEWEGALLDSYRTRIPLMFIWPGHIAAGQRMSEAVSMIDVLPTVLDLVGLAPPAVTQGQSLAPLLLGTDGWKPRPVIFEQIQADLTTGAMTGHIEVLDGRWGASLEIWPERAGDDPPVRRPASWVAARPHRAQTPRLLLYDVRADPFVRQNVNDLYPELVEHYTAFLEARWETHQDLARQFTSGEASPLTPEQLRTLRSLGYIR